MKTPNIEQTERQEFILNKLGKEDWIEVYRNENGPNSTTYWCALVGSQNVPDQLKQPDWGFSIGSGRPGNTVYGFKEERIEYHRYGDNDGFQPLVFPRRFGKGKRNYVEVSEEFRLLHDLYQTEDGTKLVKLHETGMEEDVVIVREDGVLMKLRFLRQFLAAKDMHLALFFELNCEGDRRLSDDELERISKDVKTEAVCFHLWAWNNEFSFEEGAAPSGSRLMGKKFIAPFAKSECGIFPFNERNPQFAEFVIRIDDEGKAVAASCHAEERQYLVPVFFRREVLHKYYAKPEMYSVEAGYIRGGQWGLPIDDEHRDHVVVPLGDLGKHLPYEEQLYWKSYNVPPDGGYSHGWWQRNMLGMWTKTTHPEFLFKFRFRIFQEAWERKFGWPLFLPLREDDRYLLATLRIPLNEEQAEFDGQVLALAKLIIDSLNEAEIGKLLPNKIEGEKGMAKFERFLTLNGVAAESICTYLRRLYGLRHGVGHRKGDSYERAAEFFGIGKQPLKQVFIEILIMATELLRTLDRKFVEPKEE